MCVIKNNNKNACNKWQNWWGSWLYLTLFYVISEKVLAGMCGAAIYNIMSDTNAFSIHWEKWGRKFYRSRLKRQEHKLVANVCCVWMRINRKYLTRGVTAILITSHTKHYNLYYTYIRVSSFRQRHSNLFKKIFTFVYIQHYIVHMTCNI